MAKKPSSKAKRGKRPVEKSAVKGGGIMSINKSNTSPGMKVILIILIISFVLLFSYGGITGFIDLFKNQPATTTTASSGDAVAQIKATYGSRITALDTIAASNPTSYTVWVNLANTRYSYAQELSNASQTASAAAPLASQEWAAARDAFAKAAKIQKLDQGVLSDYSVTQFYSAQTTEAVNAAIATAVTGTKRFPTFAPTYYNLGIFYEAIGQTESAIVAFQRYIVLDPKGEGGDPAYAAQQLKALGASVPSTATAQPSSTPSATTP